VINKPGAYKRSLLHWSVIYNDLFSYQTLLTQKACPYRDSQGLLPLDYARISPANNIAAFYDLQK
jgi:hypothetical protein